MTPRAAAAALLVLVLAVTACTGDGDGDDPGQPLPTTAVPASETVAIGDVEWSWRESPLRGATFLGASATSLLVVGTRRGEDEVVQVLDRASGQVRWERAESEEPGVPEPGSRTTSMSFAALGSSADDPVLVPYRVIEGGRYSAGVVARHQETGRVLWRRDLVTPRRAPYLGIPTVRGFHDGVAVVATDNYARRDRAFTTHGVDLRTGRLLWTDRRGEAVGMAHGYVILDNGPRPLLLDVATGDLVWRSAGPGELRAVIEGAVVFAEQAPGGETVTGGTLVWLDSDETADTAEWYWQAAPRNDLLVWESDVDGHRLLHTLAAGETEPVVAEVADGVPPLGLVHTGHGHVFYLDSDEGVTYVVGRDGQVVDTVDAPLVEVGADYLLVGVRDINQSRVDVLGLG